MNVFIGRFQPFHKAHLASVRKGLDKNALLLIVIGSINKARDIKNPFTYEEREDMIRGCLTDEQKLAYFYRGYRGRGGL